MLSPEPGLNTFMALFILEKHMLEGGWVLCNCICDVFCLKVYFLVYSDFGMYFKVIISLTLPEFFICLHVYVLSHV